MATKTNHRADEPGGLFETHKGRDSRVLLFYGFMAGLLLVLAGGVAYQQLFKSGTYHVKERLQTERRILIPGPRGAILDRYGRLLVGNRPRFALVLNLEELQPQYRREAIQIRNNYRAGGDRDLPTWGQLERIAHTSVAQQYLDQVNNVLGTQLTVDPKDLARHFDRQLLMPYVLVDDLTAAQFARLLEKLPVNSPIQFYTSTARSYPHGSAASHVLGYVGVEDNVDAEDFPGEDLTTFKMKGTVGRDGLEKEFDSQLQGQAGGAIYRVDPAGFKVNPPLERRMPVPGKDLVTSLDLDLQQTAEEAIGDRMGAAVALDVHTGEVLVMASKPDYDLNAFSPRLSSAAAADIEKRGAWLNLAIAALWPPGSTFKTVVSIAGLRRGTLSPDDTSVDCEGGVRIGNRLFKCDNGDGHHGRIGLTEAIAESCDIYFYEHGIAIGPQAIADEAKRFHLDRPTGIELPGESKRMIIPDAAWKRRVEDAPWTDGDTANTAIGQGYVQVTPVEMACYTASLARGETATHPYLLHDPNRPTQHSQPIGLTPEQREVILDGMIACTNTTYPDDTAYVLSTIDAYRIPGVEVAGKTGTAQYGKGLNIAWFICFAPARNPQIAIAVALQSDKPGEGYGGGLNAAPVAALIMRKYFEERGTTPAVAWDGRRP